MLAFVRSFMGIYILNLRLGEILVGISLILTFLILFLLILKNNIFYEIDKDKICLFFDSSRDFYDNFFIKW